MSRSFSVFLIVILLGACQLPVTNLAGAALGAYDSSKRRETYLQYAQKGDVYSQYELADSLCCKRTHGPIDYAQSYKWFCRAARNGHAKAQMKLGDLHIGSNEFEPLTITKDRALSYVWYFHASRRANAEAARKKKELGKDLAGAEWQKINQFLRYPIDQLPCNQFREPPLATADQPAS